MIKFRKGDIINADVEALVNTVNTEGVMGKGIALEFKQHFPKNYEFYRKACENGEVEIGKMLVYETGKLTYPHFIINFPTKKHWKNPSKLEYINEGLIDLSRIIKQYEIKSIAIPPLGCGNGKLNWNEVKPLIINAVENIDNLKTDIFEPSEEVYKEKVKINKKKDTGLTPARAIVVSLLDKYRILGYEPSLLEIQKLAYFAQRFGENLKLQYQKNQFGPYAKNLSFLLDYLDGLYIEGMKHKNAKPFDPIKIIDEKLSEVNSFVQEKLEPKHKENLNKVLKLIEGFESPLGMELLSTVDYIINTKGSIDPVSIIKEINNWSNEEKWNERKKNKFNEDYIEIAYNRLMEYKEYLYSN